jgi:hypothetical protein
VERDFQTHIWTNANLLVYVDEGIAILIGHINGIKFTSIKFKM